MNNKKVIHIYCYLIDNTYRESFERAIKNRKAAKETLRM